MSSLIKAFAAILVPLLLFLNSAISAPIEIPLDALLGKKSSLVAWQSEFSKSYLKRLDSLQKFSPSKHTIVSSDEFDGLTLLTVKYEYPLDSPLSKILGGGILAFPKTIDPSKPIIIAIHGHEQQSWGDYPIGLFREKKWAYEMAKAGYVVWAPISMYHNEISLISEVNSFPVIWTKIISEGLTYGAKNLWPQLVSGYVSSGLSAGGQITYMLMAYRTDIRSGVFAGSFARLSWLRDYYKIIGHPDCWDISWINSYVEIQAMIAPRPIQFQLGVKDPFYPNSKPLGPEGDWFKGTQRNQYTTEVAGDALLLKSIYEIYGNSDNLSFYIHEGDHEMVVQGALDFIQKH